MNAKEVPDLLGKDGPAVRLLPAYRHGVEMWPTASSFNEIMHGGAETLRQETLVESPVYYSDLVMNAKEVSDLFGKNGQWRRELFISTNS